MKGYLLAPLTPLGRVSLSAYWIMFAPLTVMLLTLRFCLKITDTVSDTGLAFVLVLLWMQFCVLCRRLQDNNFPGMAILPLFGFVAFLFTSDLDPILLGADPEEIALTWGLMFKVSYIAVGVLGMLWCYAMLVAGDFDENDYGPPFGETSESAKLKRAEKIRGRVRAEFGNNAHPDDRPAYVPPAQLTYEVRGGLVTILPPAPKKTS